MYILFSRTEEAVEHFLEKIEATPRDDEFIALLHEIHNTNIVGHPYRGYTVLSDSGASHEVAVSSLLLFVCPYLELSLLV